MSKEKIMKFYANHKGEILGSTAGLAIAILILTLNFYRTLFIFVCVAAGYYIGKNFAMVKNILNGYINKFLER